MRGERTCSRIMRHRRARWSHELFAKRFFGPIIICGAESISQQVDKSPGWRLAATTSQGITTAPHRKELHKIVVCLRERRVPGKHVGSGPLVHCQCADGRKLCNVAECHEERATSDQGAVLEIERERIPACEGKAER